MQRMISQFHTSIHSAYPFYYYIGSEPLWRQHIAELTRMKDRLKTVQDPRKFPFDSLPLEIQCEIMKKLDHGKDLLSIGFSSKNFYYVTQELLLWKQLCHHHFGEQTNANPKVISDLMKKQASKEPAKEHPDWKKVYFKLKKRYGHREIYAEMINQCQACRTFVWQVWRRSARSISLHVFCLGSNAFVSLSNTRTAFSPFDPSEICKYVDLRNKRVYISV